MRRITTVEHLGPDATESDLTEFLRCVELVQGLVPGRTEDEAIDIVWNNGRKKKNQKGRSWSRFLHRTDV